jgi:hypothetical protein
VVVVFIVVGSKLEKTLFIGALTTWEATERGKRARTFFVGERGPRGRDSTVLSGGGLLWRLWDSDLSWRSEH